MSECAAVIRVKPWGIGQGDFVEINADDFDPLRHELHEQAVIATAAPNPQPLPARVTPGALAGVAAVDHATKRRGRPPRDRSQ